MQISEREAETALRSLDGMELVRTDHGSRVERYENRARTVFHLRRDETALLCLLLLRGPQTPGELRGRAERLFAFDDIAQVSAALQRMSTNGDEDSQRVEPLVRVLPRQPGSREVRYAQVLTGATAEDAATATDVAIERDAGGPREDSTGKERMQALEGAMEALTERVRRLEEQLGLAAATE